jgi:hypothetical protein
MISSTTKNKRLQFNTGNESYSSIKQNKHQNNRRSIRLQIDLPSNFTTNADISSRSIQNNNNKPVTFQNDSLINKQPNGIITSINNDINGNPTICLQITIDSVSSSRSNQAQQCYSSDTLSSSSSSSSISSGYLSSNASQTYLSTSSKREQKSNIYDKLSYSTNINNTTFNTPTNRLPISSSSSSSMAVKTATIKSQQNRRYSFISASSSSSSYSNHSNEDIYEEISNFNEIVNPPPTEFKRPFTKYENYEQLNDYASSTCSSNSSLNNHELHRPTINRLSKNCHRREYTVNEIFQNLKNFHDDVDLDFTNASICNQNGSPTVIKKNPLSKQRPMNSTVDSLKTFFEKKQHQLQQQPQQISRIKSTNCHQFNDSTSSKRPQAQPFEKYIHNTVKPLLHQQRQSTTPKEHIYINDKIKK